MSRIHRGPGRAGRRAWRATSLRGVEGLEERQLLTSGLPGISVSPTSGLVTTEYGESASFRVSMDAAPTAPVTIAVSSSNIGEGTVYPSTLTFTPQNWDILKLVSVTGVDDSSADGDVTYSVVLAPAVSGDARYNGIDPADVSVVNTDSDTASFAVTSLTNGVVTATKSATFQVALTSAPAGTVTVPVSTSDPDQTLVSDDFLVFNRRNWQVPQEVTVFGNSLAAPSSNTPFSILLGKAISTDPSYNRLDPPDPTLTYVVDRAAQESAAMAEMNDDMNMPSDMSMSQQDDPQMEAEQDGVLALVPISAATNIAIADGDWSDPDTWMDQQVPGKNADVWIMPGRTVTLDAFLTTPIHTIRDSGTLRFDPHANTQLRVDTLVVDTEGTLLIGTPGEAIDAKKTARIVFTDTGPIDATWDPHRYSRGLVSLGKTVIQGATKTAYLPLAGLPAPGSTKITLASPAVGWRAGDRLILPEPAGKSGTEETFLLRTISADGKTITLDHAPKNPLWGYYQPGEQLVIANMTRNVVFQSANAADASRRGYVMFMHNPDVSVSYADFIDLGRTAGGTGLGGKLAPNPAGPGNPIGRYAVHFHMAGADVDDAPAVVQGCVVDGSPGWGYVNHSSHVVMTDDISHGAAVAGFVTEAGDETGAFRRDLAIGGPATAFGAPAYGFWMHSPGVDVTDNVATGFNTIYNPAFFIWAQGSAGIRGTLVTFDTDNLQDKSFKDTGMPDGQSRIEYVPYHLARNVVYGSWGGIEVVGSSTSLDPDRPDIIEGGTIWDVSDAITYNYTDGGIIRDVHMYGLPGIIGGSGVHGDNAPVSVLLDNLTISGFGVGVYAFSRGTTVVAGGQLDNLTNVAVGFGTPEGWAAALRTRVVDVRGVTFAHTTPTSNPADLALSQDNYQVLTDNGLWRLFAENQILFNGEQVYFPSQVASNVVSGTGVPELDGKTNAQIWAQYHLAIGGQVAPIDAAPRAGVLGGLVGSRVDVPAMIPLSSPRFSNDSNYLPAFYDGISPQTYAPTVSLRSGWNLIPTTYLGQPRTVLVFGPAQADDDIRTRDMAPPGNLPDISSSPIASSGAVAGGVTAEESSATSLSALVAPSTTVAIRPAQAATQAAVPTAVPQHTPGGPLAGRRTAGKPAKFKGHAANRGPRHSRSVQIPHSSTDRTQPGHGHLDRLAHGSMRIGRA